MQKRSLFAMTLLLSAALAQAAVTAPAKPAAKKAAKPAAAAKAPAKAAVAIPLKAAAGTQLTVNGDSTMHKWKADAQDVVITAEQVKAGDLLAAVQGQGLAKLQLVAKAGSLKSNEGKSMDKNMHKAMEAEKFPEISFALAGYELKGDEVAAKGTLTIHGTAKEVVLPGKVSAKDGGVNVKGSYDLKMSDYGIKPPVMMMGTIKVADALTIAYDFTLVP